MKNDIARLNADYDRTRKEFMLGHLDVNFYEDCLFKLKESIELFDKHATSSEKRKENPLKTKAQCLLVIGLYWIGRNKEAREVLETVKEAVDEVIATADSLENRGVRLRLSRLSDDQRRLLREKIRIAIHFALIFHYHQHRYNKAEEILLKCLKLIAVIRDEDKLPFYGTTAIANFHLAKLMRNLHRWGKAEEYLRNAMEQHLERVQFKKRDLSSKPGSEQELSEELTFSRYRTAIFLSFGRGWSNFHAGLLWIALYNNVIPARVSLEETRDLVNKGFLQMFEGCIRRELYANNQTQLKKALSMITGARDDFFQPMNHSRFMELADYEEVNTKLVLSVLLKKHERQIKTRERYVADALRTLQRLKDHATARNDVRWNSHYLTLESRIESHQKKYLRAVDLATQSLDILNEGHRDKVYRIEALIARSIAYVEMSRGREAITDLKEARLLNRDQEYESVPVSPKLEAIIYTTLARAHSRSRELREATACLETARDLSSKVENTMVLEMIKEAATEIEEAIREGFEINLGDLKIDANVDRLRRHLARLALELTKGDVSKAAKLLGKDKSSIFRYRRIKPT
jgi:tetratricopeptide (TPR) repeat protein